MFVWILITSQVNEINIVSVTLHCWYLKAGQYNLISYSSSLLQAATAYPPIHNQCQYALYRKLLLANILWILSCMLSSPKGILWYWKKTPDRCVRWLQWENASCKACVYVYIYINRRWDANACRRFFVQVLNDKIQQEVCRRVGCQIKIDKIF